MAEAVKFKEPAPFVPRPRETSPIPSTSGGVSSLSTPIANLPNTLIRQVLGYEEDTGPRRSLGSRRQHDYIFRRTKMTIAKLKKATRALEMIKREKRRRQKEAKELMCAALEHFANTVNGIADQLEGKELPPDHEENAENFKKRLEAANVFLTPERLETLNAQTKAEEAEEASRSNETEEEAAKRLQNEMEAAIAALSREDEKPKEPFSFLDLNQTIIQLLE